jgi:hypothetical protein
MEIQNLFNHLDLIDRARTHNYTVTWLSWMAASPALSGRLGEPAIKVLLRFQVPDQLVVFDVHAYLARDLRILGSSLMDPKTVFFLRRVYFSASAQ